MNFTRKAASIFVRIVGGLSVFCGAILLFGREFLLGFIFIILGWFLIRVGVAYKNFRPPSKEGFDAENLPNAPIAASNTSKKMSKDNDKLRIFDLIYAKLREGSSWGDQPRTWNMKNGFCGYGFIGSWDRCLRLELMREATIEERISFATLPTLKPICKECGISTTGKKADIIERIIASGDLSPFENILPHQVALTDKANGLLEKHSYIPYIISDLKFFDLDFDLIFSQREKGLEKSDYELIASTVDEESFYTEDCEITDDMDSEEKADVREAIQDAKGEYRDFMAKIKADHKEGRL